MKVAALEQAPMHNESQANRLRQEVTGLKSNIVEADVKCRFTQAISTGEPLPVNADDPTVKAAFDKTHEQLKNTKSTNDKLRHEIQQIVSDIADGDRDFKQQKQVLGAQLDAVATAQCSNGGASKVGASDEAALDVAMEGEAQAEVDQLESIGRAKEQDLAACQEDLTKLEAELLRLDREILGLQGKASDKAALRAAQEAAHKKIADHQEKGEHSRQLRTLLETFGGVRIVKFGEDSIHVQLSTVVPRVRPGEVAVPALETLVHEVVLHLEPGTCSLRTFEAVPE
eukprot:gene10331-12217_t